MPETEIDFTPGPLGSPRRRVPPLIAGLAIVAFLGVAVAKPWGALPAEATASPATSPGPSALAERPGPAATPDGSAAARPTGVAVGSQPPVGSWGVGLGLLTATDPADPVADWLAWAPIAPMTVQRGPSIPDPVPGTSDCASLPTLAVAGPSIVGIAIPDATTSDVSILAWWSNGLAPLAVDDYLDRLDLPGGGAVAELARVDGLPWPDGRYDFQVITQSRVTSLGFCIDSSIGAKVAPRLDPAMETEVVRQLSPRAGSWGVGTGGSGPRLVRDDPWVDWVAVDPVESGPGTNVALWPGTGVCDGAPEVYGSAALVAITVPSGLVPDWRVITWWTNGVQIARFDRLVREVSPPGNRGITYLERVDAGNWPDGRYEFHVVAGDHEMTLTVCLRPR